MEKFRNSKKKKKKFLKRNIFEIIFLSIVLVAFLVLVINTSPGKSVTGKVVASYDELTLKLECKQQPYEALEYYYEEVPYDTIEKYNEVVSGKNCDYTSGCYCIHESWLGLGPCDSCRCTKERTITKYRTKKKSRTVTKLQEVCIKLRKWQSPNYNEDWFNYPKIYTRTGGIKTGGIVGAIAIIIILIIKVVEK